MDWIGHDVAVKFLRPSLVATPELVERLRVEARAVAGIHHRGVVFIMDCGIDESAGPHLVMRYVEGESLRSELARVGRLTPGRTTTRWSVLRIARDPAPALPSDVPPDVRAVVEGALAKDPTPVGLRRRLCAGRPGGRYCHTVHSGLTLKQVEWNAVVRLDREFGPVASPAPGGGRALWWC